MIDFIKSEERVLQDWHLDDTSLVRSNWTIPMPREHLLQAAFGTHDEGSGADYGALYLRPYYQRLLEANGVEPFTPAECGRLDMDYDFYVLVGTPSDALTMGGSAGQQGYAHYLLPLERLPEAPRGMEKPLPRFYARLGCVPVSIRGMSGGPILAFRLEGGNWRYQVLAIQSTWNKKDIVSAVPVCLLADWLDATLGGPRAGTAAQQNGEDDGE